MTSRLVLGHPYHGAFYWLCSAENWRSKPLRAAPQETHGYYRTLYGSSPHAVLDELVSICLLYDEIYLAPADCPLPDFGTRQRGEDYRHDELGIVTSWNWSGDHYELEQLVNAAAADLRVQDSLKRIPATSRKQLIRTAIEQIKIRKLFGADFLATTSHIRLCERIEQGLWGQLQPADARPNALLRALKLVLEIASLHFFVQTVGDFIALRTEASVRSYAESFRAAVESASPDSERAIYRAMMEAMNKDALTARISGGLNIVASLSGVVSLIPVAGTIGGAVGLASDAGSKLAQRIGDQNKWWTLAPEISRVLTRSRVEKRYKELERASTSL